MIRNRTNRRYTVMAAGRPVTHTNDQATAKRMAAAYDPSAYVRTN